MLAYWLLFAFFASGAMLAPARRRLAGASRNPNATTRVPATILFTGGAIATALVIGLRYKVGADWNAYQYILDAAAHRDLAFVLSGGELGYQFLNWLVQQLGLRIWAINLVCAVIFTWGLWRFARQQPEPWLVIVVAMSYLIVVVAMGYTRQAAALGFILGGIAALERGASTARVIAYIVAAALFHRTAVVVLPLIMFAVERNRALNFIAALLAMLLLYNYFIAGFVDRFLNIYIEAGYSSQGAAIRVGMTFLAALLYLASPARFGFSRDIGRMWRYFSYAAALLLLLLLLVPSSTAVDRLSLFVIPLQLAVLSRFPLAYFPGTIGRFFVVAYSALVLFVWLNFAVHARYWVPYQFFPISIPSLA